VFLRLFGKLCHTTRAVGQTPKGKENYFWYFKKWVSHGAGDRTKWKGIFSFFRFITILWVFM